MSAGPPTRPSRAKARVLLLQARREGDPTRDHELRCFAEKLGLERDQVGTHDLVGGPPALSGVLAYDALLIGGSGEFYVSHRNLPHFDELLDLLGEVVAHGHPLFGSCFGYQCLVETLGGQVRHDPPATEVGTFELELTCEGRADPLFAELPERFRAQLGHADRATHHPAGVPNLARSVLSPLQALRVPGKPIWATQFHPELCHRTNLERFYLYRERYAEDVRARVASEGKARFDRSDETSRLLRRFLELVL